MNELELYQSRRKTARIAGVFYLMLILAAFPPVLRERLIVAGDAVATGRNLLRDASLFKWSIFGDLAVQIALLFLVLSLYSLLKDVRPSAAQSMVALVLVAVPLAMLAAVNGVSALSMLQGSSPDPALASAFLVAYKNGILLAGIFWGLWLFPQGWLFYHSGFMPKTLGILLMISSLGYLLNSLAGLFIPEWRAVLSNGATFAGVVELATVFWLLVFGVMRLREPKRVGKLKEIPH